MTTLIHIRKPLLLLPVLLILGVAIAWAQLGQRAQTLRARVGSGEIFDNPKVMEQLGLSDAQVATVKEELEAVKRAQIELDAQMKLLQIDLRKAVDADTIDENAVADITKKIGELRGKQLENNLKRRVVIHNTLTDEQREQARETMREKTAEWRAQRAERAESGAAIGPRAQWGARGDRGQAWAPRGARGPQYNARPGAVGPRTGAFGPRGIMPDCDGQGPTLERQRLRQDAPGAPGAPQFWQRGPRPGFKTAPADEPVESEDGI